MNYIKTQLLPIETDRLILRLLEPEEAALMAAYVTENRAHLEPWEPGRSDAFFLTELWRKELIHRQNQFFTGQALRLAIFLKDQSNGPVIGVCNYTEFMRGVFQACYLGYSMHCLHQGKGIMFEALNAANTFVFNTFKLHRIMANYMPRNERSEKLLKKLGFVVEGFARDYLKINGQWEDHILTAKIRAEK